MPGVSNQAREKAMAKDEREIQKLICGYLRQIGAFYIQSRMDRRTTNQPGTPDFVICYQGRTEFWEVKCPWSQRLRPEQIAAKVSIEDNGGTWRLITSLTDAQEALRL